MRKEKNQVFWPWAALVFLLGPIVFSACSLLGFNINQGIGTKTPTPTLVSTLVLPTSAATVPVSLTKEPIKTATRSATLVPTVQKPSSTATRKPLPPPTLVPPTATPEPKPYALQVGSPKLTRAFAHADQGCKWLGIAGQVFDASGQGAKEVAVLVTGMVNGQAVERAVLTDDQSVYGPGGFEIYLSDRPATGTQAVTIQLYNLQSQPLSDPQVVNLPKGCEQNLILLNFQGSYIPKKVFMPALFSAR